MADKETVLLVGILLPFLGTSLGAAAIFVLKSEMSLRLQKALMGFAAGIMTAASVWSLLLPSIETAENSGGIAWLPATAGFLAGGAFLLALDHAIPKICGKIPDKRKNGDLMLVLAVTLHNIPEGMAVGVAMAGIVGSYGIVGTAEALALSVGIAVQNFPEGAIVSAPLLSGGYSKGRSFLYGVLSGAVEPAAAVITMLLTSLVAPVLPYILSFAAGAMIYVAAEELIPGMHEEENGHVGVVGLMLGFALMMLLDVALG